MPAVLDPVNRRLSLVPTDPGFDQNPYPVYERIRAMAPVFFWEQYGHWCVMGHQEVGALLRDRRFGREILHVATRQELGWPEPEPHTRDFYAVDDLTLLSREPPVHTRLRSLVNRAFVSRQVERLRPRIETLAHELIDRMQAQGREADLIRSFATPIPVIVIAELLGVPAEMTPSLLDWSHRMVAMYQFKRSRADEDGAVEATNAFVAFLREYVADRRRQPAEDLISTMIAAESDGQRLSEEELIANCTQLLNAGHEATVHAIGNGVKAILESGLPPEALFADETATEATVEETMRFDAPLHMFTRYALQDLEVCGLKLRKGQEIGLLLAAANRDPLVYDEASRFWPERPRVAHQSFGGGIHFCIGAPLARLEMQVAMPILFKRLPGLRMTATPRYSPTYHFHGLESLSVGW